MGRGDSAISFVIHFAMSEIAHHDFKSHWEKWQEGVFHSQAGIVGIVAHLRRRLIADLECAQSPPHPVTFSSMVGFSGADPLQARGVQAPQASLGDQPE